MYNKNKKPLKPNKKAKFTKKEIIPVVNEPEIIEPVNNIPDTGILELIQPIDTKYIIQTPIPIIIHSDDVVSYEIEGPKKPLKTRIKKEKNKSNIKKAKFTKKSITEEPEIIDSKIEIIEEPKEIPNLAPTPIPDYNNIPEKIAEVIPSPYIKKDYESELYQIKLYEYSFNNFENENVWTGEIHEDMWPKSNIPKLNTWIVDYFKSKDKKLWYKNVHYFSQTKIDILPPFSPLMYNSEGCI